MNFLKCHSMYIFSTNWLTGTCINLSLFWTGSWRTLSSFSPPSLPPSLPPPLSHFELFLINLSFVVCSGKAAIPILWKFLNRWPNPDTARKGDWQAMARLLAPLGLHEKRAKIIIRFSGRDQHYARDLHTIHYYFSFYEIFYRLFKFFCKQFD